MLWPKFIAHRGASAIAPENTIASLQFAIDLGAKAVEFDIQPASDGRLVVFHDADLNRCCNLKEKIFNLDSHQIAQTEANYQFGQQQPPIYIPSFDQYLELLEQSNLFMNCELKCHARLSGHHTSTFTHSYLARLAQLKERCLITSSCKNCLEELIAAGYESNLGYITHHVNEDAINFINRFHLRSISVNYKTLTDQHIKVLKKHGITIMAYTVNHYPTALALFKRGVDSIFSDVIFTETHQP